jgi:hypothetical protein
MNDVEAEICAIVDGAYPGEADGIVRLMPISRSKIRVDRCDPVNIGGTQTFSRFKWRGAAGGAAALLLLGDFHIIVLSWLRRGLLIMSSFVAAHVLARLIALKLRRFHHSRSTSGFPREGYERLGDSFSRDGAPFLRQQLGERFS